MRKNNKGMSYVELLLVLAIMAILVAVASLTIGLISRTNVNRGAEKLVSAINLARSTSMARGRSDGALEITYDGDNYYYYIGNVSAANKDDLKVEFLSSPATVTYATAAAPANQVPFTRLIINFDQSSGKIVACFDQSANVIICDNITLSNGDKTATIKVYPATGKCDLVY